MTLPELKQHFETAKAMILAEKAMRRRVFRDKPRPEGSRAAKLAAPREGSRLRTWRRWSL